METLVLQLQGPEYRFFPSQDSRILLANTALGEEVSHAMSTLSELGVNKWQLFKLLRL